MRQISEASAKRSEVARRAGPFLVVALVALAAAWPAGAAGNLVVDVGSAGCSNATAGDELDVFLPQGDDAGTANGDYISDQGGLDDPYRYWVEVPSGVSRLVVEVFDADVGVGSGSANEPGSGECGRDRARGGSFNTSATYELFDPSGAAVGTQFGTGDNAGPAGADNAWLTFYDSNTPAPPAFVASNTTIATSASSSLTITRPGAATAGDLLIALIVIDDDNGDIAPSGSTWTQLDEGECTGNACRTAVFWRITTAGEPASFTFDWAGGGTEEAAGGILRYSGVDTSSPIDVSAFAADADSTPDAPSVTTTVANARVVRLLGGDNDDFSAHPAGHTGRFAVETGGADESVMAAAADAAQASAGATGVASFTLAASQDTRVGTVALRPAAAAAAPANGHWELRLTMNDANDLNAVGVRAHDGTTGSGGTELNVYYHAQTQYGVNPPGSGSSTRDYLMFPYITQGCTAHKDDFDYDSQNSASQGSVALASRTSAFTASFVDSGTGTQGISANNVWQRDSFSGWTDDFSADDYGLWQADIAISNYTNAAGINGNYSNVAFMTSAAAAPPPGDNAPTANAFRVYLPTDGGAAPVKAYLAQFVRHVDGPNPPVAGQTTRVQVTVRFVDPEAQAVI